MRYFALAGVWILSLVFVANHPTVFAQHSLSPYGQFAGTWYYHGGGAIINANGTGTDHYRTYRNCTAQITTDCDMFLKQGIYAGGFTQFRLYKVTGNKAVGTVTNDAVSWLVGTTLTITRRSNDTLAIRMVQGTTNACGPKSPPGYCGA